MRRLSALSVFVIACGTAPAPTSSTSAALLAPSGTVHPGTCLVPLAVPSDGQDDRVAIQDAIDNQGCAFLAGCGIYDIDPNTGSSGQQHIGILNLRGGASFTGVSPCAQLRFRGTWMGTKVGIRIWGANNLLSSLSIDTSAVTTNDEQSHAVEIIGNAVLTPQGTTDGNTITNVWFDHPHFPGQIKGDCIRVLGEQLYQVKRTLITGNQFIRCKRSAVAIQRGVYDWTLLGNTFLQSTDQMIDGEQSGSAQNGRGIIVGNTFFATSGKYAMQFSGTETKSLLVSLNTISGQGIQCYNCKNFSFVGNTVTHANPGSVDATVQIYRQSSSVVVGNNVIRRETGTGAPVVSITGLTPAGTSATPQYPSNVSVTGNVIYQGTPDVGISVLSTATLTVSGNTLELGAGLAGPHAIKVARSSSTQPLSTDVSVTGNTLTGPWQIGVTLQGVAGATLHGNALTSSSPGAKGLSCTASTAIVSSGNNWSASSCAAATGGNP